MKIKALSYKHNLSNNMKTEIYNKKKPYNIDMNKYIIKIKLHTT